MPPGAVYFVSPFVMASIPDCLIFSGVSKSGSPAPNPMTSIPCAFSALAFAVIVTVADGFSFLANFDNCINSYLVFVLSIIVFI